MGQAPQTHLTQKRKSLDERPFPHTTTKRLRTSADNLIKFFEITLVEGRTARRGRLGPVTNLFVEEKKRRGIRRHHHDPKLSESCLQLSPNSSSNFFSNVAPRRRLDVPHGS